MLPILIDSSGLKKKEPDIVLLPVVRKGEEKMER